VKKGLRIFKSEEATPPEKQAASKHEKWRAEEMARPHPLIEYYCTSCKDIVKVDGSVVFASVFYDEGAKVLISHVKDEPGVHRVISCMRVETDTGPESGLDGYWQHQDVAMCKNLRLTEKE
jgi:hypothetical protein